MQFPRNENRDERRRRALIDEQSPAAAPAPRPRTARKTKPSGETKLSRPRYSDAALAHRQPHFTDLLPKRLWVFGVLVFAGVLIVAGLTWLHAQIGELSQTVPRDKLAAIDAGSAGNLAAWFSSSLLLAAAVGSLQIYNLRRHKIDDYRGRYRVWVWAAMALLLASVDATAQLHLVLQGVLVHATGATLAGDGALWWWLCFSAGYGALAIRMAIEMRSSRGATVALALSVLTYGGAATVGLELIVVGDVVAQASATAAAAMSGHSLVLLTVGLYARYVYLDAQGELVVAKQSAEATEIAPSKNKAKPSRKVKTIQAVNESQEQPAATPDKPRAKSRQEPSRQRTAKETQDQQQPSEPANSSQPKSKRRKQKRKPASAGDDRPQLKIATPDADAGPNRPQSKKKKNKPSSQQTQRPRASDADSDGSDEIDFQEVPEKLSKSARRRLRKQRRSEQRRAA